MMYRGTINVTLGNLEDVQNVDYENEQTAAKMGDYFYSVDTPTELAGSFDEWANSEKSVIAWEPCGNYGIRGTFEFECETGYSDQSYSDQSRAVARIWQELYASIEDDVYDALDRGVRDDELGPEGSPFHVFNLERREQLRAELGNIQQTRQNLTNILGSSEFQDGDFSEVYAALSDSVEKLENLIYYPEYNESMYIPIICENYTLAISVA